MKLRLPHSLRAALAAVATAALPIATTVATGALITATTVAPQAEARDLATNTTTVGDVTYNGCVFTMENITSLTKNFASRQFTLFQGYDSTHTEGKAYQSANSNISTPYGNGWFWTMFSDSDPLASNVTGPISVRGVTLRLAGATVKQEVLTDFSDFCLGGLIVEASTISDVSAASPAYWFKRPARMALNGTRDVNLTINDFTRFSYKEEIAVKKGGVWNIAQGKALVFDNNDANNPTTVKIYANNAVEVKGGGTLQIGTSGMGATSLELETGSSLTVGATSTVDLVSTGTVTLAAGVDAGHCTSINNAGAMTIAGAITTNANTLVTNSGNMTVSGAWTCGGNIVSTGTITLASLSLGDNATAFFSGNTTVTGSLTAGTGASATFAANSTLKLGASASPITFSNNTKAYGAVYNSTTNTATLTFGEDAGLDVTTAGATAAGLVIENSGEGIITVTINSLTRTGTTGGNLSITGSDNAKVLCAVSSGTTQTLVRDNNDGTTGALTMGKNVSMSFGVLGVASGKTVKLTDNAYASANQLRLGDYRAQAGTLELTDNSVFEVKGTSNVNTNAASLLIAHWDYSATGYLKLRDNAELKAAGAVMYMQLDGLGVFDMTGGKATVKGINFQGKEKDNHPVIRGTFTLDGGDLHIGESGIYGISKGAAGDNAARVNFGAATITADASWQTTVHSASTDGNIHLTATGNSATTLDTQTYTVTFNHQLDNGGNLRKIGSGTLQLNADADANVILEAGTLAVGNAQLTSLNIKGGTLQGVESGASVGSISVAQDAVHSVEGTISIGSILDGVLTVNNSGANVTFTGETGTGTLKLVSGTLSGQNVGHTVDFRGGTLSSFVLSGGTLDLGYKLANQSAGTVSGLRLLEGNIALGDALLSLDLDTQHTLIASGVSEVNFNTLTVNGVSVDNDGRFYVMDSTDTIVRRGTFSYTDGGLGFTLENFSIHALAWVGGSGTWNEENARSWQQMRAFAADDSVTFTAPGTSASSPGMITLVGELQPSSITMEGFYTFTGEGHLTGAAPLTLGNGTDASAMTIETSNPDWSGSALVRSGSTLTLAQADAAGTIGISLEEQARLVIDGRFSATMANAISGAGSLEVTGRADVTLTSAANTYSGGTTISGNSALTIASATGLGTGDVVVDNGALHLNVENATGGVGITLNGGSVTLGASGALAGSNISFAGGTLVYGTGVTDDVSSQLSGAVSVDVAGNNAVWAGTPGTSLAVYGTTGSLRLNSTENAGPAEVTLKGGTLVLSNAKALAHNGDNKITSAVTIEGGNLKFIGDQNGAGTYASATSYFTYMFDRTLNISLAEGENSTISVDNTVALTNNTYNGIGFAQANALVYDGSKGGGTLTIAANISAINTNTPTFDISRSTLRDTNPGSLPTGFAEVEITGWIGEHGRSANVTYISGAAGNNGASVVLTKTGDGTLKISGKNFAPGITVQEGTVIINNEQGTGWDRTAKNVVQVGTSATTGTATFDLWKSNTNAISQLKGTEKGVITNTSSTVATLKVGKSAVALDSAFDGSITGNLALNVAARTLTLGGVNNYTGNTTIDNGAILSLSGSGSISGNGLTIAATSSGNAALTGGTGGLTLTKNTGSATTTLGGNGTLANTELTVANAKLVVESGVSLNATSAIKLAGSAQLGGGVTNAGLYASGSNNALVAATLTSTSVHAGLGEALTTNALLHAATAADATVNTALNIVIDSVDRTYMLGHTNAIYKVFDNVTLTEGTGLTVNGKTADANGFYQVKVGTATYQLKLLTDDGALGIANLSSLTNKLQWQGGDTGVWKASGSAGGWNDLTTNTVNVAYDNEAGSIVVFDGAGTTTYYTLTVEGTVSPAEVIVQGKAVVSMTAADGGGKIAGDGELNVSGAGTSLTLGMVNEYTGGALVEKGATLNATVENALGTGAVTVTGAGSTLTIGAGSSHNGTTIADGALLNANAAGSLGSGNICLDGGKLVLGAVDALGPAQTITFNGGSLVYGIHLTERP